MNIPSKPSSPSRRDALSTVWTAALASAALVLARSGSAFAASPATSTAPAAGLLHDTFNGLLSFIVPGPDSYSAAQGQISTTPGGVGLGVAGALIATLDETTPFVPQFSATVADVLNGLALAVAPGVAGVFASPFANLSFAQKVAVFQVMDGTEALAQLASILPPFVAFFCYSEAGAFDPVTRSLTGAPPAWQLSSYQGVAEGRDEFRGYLHAPGSGR